MELRQIIPKLKNYSLLFYGNANDTIDLYSIRYYDSLQENLSSSTIYLVNTKDLPAIESMEPLVIFCYGKHIDFSSYKDSPITLIYFEKITSPDILMNDILEILGEIQQINTGVHVMINALFSGNGLQYLIDAAAEVLCNPIYVVDLQGKYLAISTSIECENEFYHSQSKFGYISEEGLIYIRQNRIDEKVRSLEQPYYFFNNMANVGTLIDGIYIQGIEVGHIMLQESEHPLRDYDLAMFHRLSQLVGLELQKNSFYASNKGVMYSYFLADLIKDSSSNLSSIKERLATLGFRVKENLYVMVIPSFSYHQSDLRTEIITQTLIHIFPESMYIIYEGNIVFLITKKQNQGFSELETTKLKEFLIANGLNAGISNFYEDLRDTSRFYQQAVTSATLGARLNTAGPIYYYQDIFIYQMINQFEETDQEIRFLIQPGLMQLLMHEKDKDRELILTLREYLNHPGQPAKVAEALHIHKNTLLYRMGKIKEITHCSFDQGEDYLTYLLSYKILEYLNMI